MARIVEMFLKLPGFRITDKKRLVAAWISIKNPTDGLRLALMICLCANAWKPRWIYLKGSSGKLILVYLIKYPVAINKFKPFNVGRLLRTRPRKTRDIY